MLNNMQIDKLAGDLAKNGSLPADLARFVWKKEELQPAWLVRQELASAGFSDSAEQYAERVHKWGFGTSVRASVREHDSYSPAMRTLCQAWSEEQQPWNHPMAVANLVALLDIKYLGIARVSKFVCFLDQDRYAIYDSRVSYALKDLSLDGLQRVFPFVGGRPVKNARYVLNDAIANKPRPVAAVYIGFLRLLQRAAEKLNERGGITDPALQRVVGARWTPALLEMALFMAGQDRQKIAGINKLDTSLWNG